MYEDFWHATVLLPTSRTLVGKYYYNVHMTPVRNGEMRISFFRPNILKDSFDSVPYVTVARFYVLGIDKCFVYVRLVLLMTSLSYTTCLIYISGP